ncbi:hypothetical protein [Clostridium saccharobutylicum]|uniref:Uncharacterized protein n=1 Tax=Clostridium saccharobutylicum TaxID=169679 RepID=A0A1S8MTA1_CLOSA|nr:hypothetical protein [Clostridium saccharobutylicum]OOM07384.1 hypothetical protein CLOSAC_39130 [Clostridium saccharobutylicum]
MLKQIDKDKVLSEFEEKYVINQWVYKFLEVDEMYKSDKAAIEEKLISTFEEVCNKAVQLQEKRLKGEIKYVYISLLRTSILENKGEYRIDLYDENWFLDKQETSVNIDLNFVYVPLFDFINELKEKKHEYGRTITDMDIESIVLREILKFHILVVEFLRDIVKKFITVPSYENMKKSSDIKILAGEYMDEAEIIYPQK